MNGVGNKNVREQTASGRSDGPAIERTGVRGAYGCAAYDALDQICRLVARGDYDAEPADTSPMGNIDLQNIEVAVQQLDRYLALNRGMRDQLVNRFPSTLTEQCSVKAFMSCLGKAMVRMLNAHFLHISREVFCICDIEYVEINYDKNAVHVVSIYNGVDKDRILVECGNDNGEAVFSWDEWEHFSTLSARSPHPSGWGGIAALYEQIFIDENET